jgi:hypothetical protein
MTHPPIPIQIKQHRELGHIYVLNNGNLEKVKAGPQRAYTPKPLKQSWLQRNDMRLSDVLLGSALGMLFFPACKAILWAIATLGEYWK